MTGQAWHSGTGRRLPQVKRAVVACHRPTPTGIGQRGRCAVGVGLRAVKPLLQALG
ncbi:hypothetical protein D8I24_7684 (plasmid) [Cupriavidus necator H850]|nr:hypothetical protein D8I24_7684 [Cupriavidus necator H850]